MNLTDYSHPTPLVKHVLSNIKAGTALDAGCYEGRNSLYLAKLGWEVTAIDTWEEPLDALRKIAKDDKLNIKVDKADIRSYETKLPFDVVLSLMTLHFLPTGDVEPAIQRMQNWTKTGGLNIVSSFTSDCPIGTRPYLFAPGALRKFYKGWDIQEYEEAYTGWVIPEDKVKPERYMAARLVARRPT